LQAVSPSYQINMNLCFIWLNLIKVKLHRDWVTSFTTSKEIAVEKVNYCIILSVIFYDTIQTEMEKLHIYFGRDVLHVKNRAGDVSAETLVTNNMIGFQ